MAIGDAISKFLGTATETHQPSSGVEQQISAVIKPGNTDDINVYDGTNALPIFGGAIQTDVAHAVTGATRSGPYNMSIMITNTMYIKKNGTTNRFWIGGIETNV